MTGLDVVNDEIIQIACFVTDYDLNLLDEEGLELVVSQTKERMDQMDEWCTKTHAKTGLTERVLLSNITPEYAANALISYVQELIPEPGKAILAGNSVHYDKEFLRRQPYGKFLDHLHHRILDVSSIKEAARRWSDLNLLKQIPRKKGTHEARQDILESIEEARFYRDTIFRMSSEVEKKEDIKITKPSE
jgi:oligoribonuclease